MNHLYDVHFDEMRRAQELHNAAIEAAQIAYADAIQASREKLAVGLGDGLTAINSIWQGPAVDEEIVETVRARLPRIIDPLSAAMDPADAVDAAAPGSP